MNIITVICGIGLLGLFLLIRSPKCFVAICTALVIGALSATLTWCRPVELFDLVLLGVGGMGCVFGLGFVRVMLVRSVSLGALSAAYDKQIVEDNDNVAGMLERQVSGEIAMRMGDLKRWRLVKEDGRELRLAFLGRVVAGTVAFLTRCTHG